MSKVNRFGLHNLRLAYSPQRVAKVASLLAILLGCLVLLGWLFDIEVLKSFSPSNQATMKANTAVCFVLSGLSLWLLLTRGEREKGRGRDTCYQFILAKVCAVAVVVISLLTLSQYIFGWNLGIDELLLGDSSNVVTTVSAGRMGVNTALNFVLVGSALLLLSQSNRRCDWYAQVLCLIAALVSLQALIGYAYKVDILVGVFPQTTSMALHTVLTFIVLCIGILWTRVDQGLMRVVTSDRPPGVLARSLLPQAIALPLLLGWLIAQGLLLGYYDAAFAIALLILVLIVIFAISIWQSVALIDRLYTERDRTGEALKANEQKLESFVDSNIIGIVFADFDGNIQQANDEFLRIIGYTREDLLSGRIRWIDVTPPEDLYLDEQAIAEARARGACTPYEKEYIRKDGSRIPILIGYVVLGEERNDAVAFILDLTERKQVLAALQTSEERYRQLIELSPEGIFIQYEEKFVFVNSQCLQLFGAANSEQIIGKSIIDFVHPDFHAIVKQRIQQLIEQRTEVPLIEQKWLRLDGTVFDAEVKSAPFTYQDKPAAQVIIRDITGRKQAQAALQESEERFRFLTNLIPQIVWTARPDGWIDYYNQRWFDYTGMTLEETQGWGWGPVLHPDDLQLCIDRWTQAVETGLPYEFELRLKRASDGQYRWHLGRALPCKDQNGQIVKWFGTCTDIHDQKQMIAERDRALASEQAARAAAEVSNRLKDEFLAVVSHELRSPLNAILGWVQMLRAGRLNETMTAKALETIERNARAQTQLIEDLLDVSRIITGKIRLNVRTCELVPIIEAAIDTVRLAADAKEIRLQPVLDPLAGPVSGDSERLQQVIWNLLSNAIKFTPKKGRVQIRLERINSHVEITVSDTGIGITPDFLPYVFERFRQEDSSITRSYSGLGLGLAIVRHLVELHGGTVSVASPGEGQGTTFIVKLPLMPVVRLQTTNPERVHPTVSSGVPFDNLPSLEGVRVLVVDDEPDTRDFITTVLSECGAEVKAVESAAKVLEAIPQWQPDILVSDIGMPEEDGYSLIRKVRALESKRERQIPAVALTAYARVEDRIQALSSGFGQHITKPVEPAELVAVVASLARQTL